MKAKIKITDGLFKTVFDEIVDINSPKDIYEKLPKEECLGTEEQGGVTTFVYDNYDADVSVEINGKWCDVTSYEDYLHPDDGMYDY